MKPRHHELKDGSVLLIREAEPDDAHALLEYVEAISGESDYLSFGPGEFDLTEREEQDYLRKCRDSDNQLYLVGMIDGIVVSGVTFAGGRRSRMRHSGEFAISVRRDYWALGIGSFMIDALIDWARSSGIVTKINLRVRTDNQRAMALYTGKGFVIEGTISREMLLDGKYYSHHWMGLEL